MIHSNPEPPKTQAAQPVRGIGLLLWRGFWLAFLVGSLAYAGYCFYAPSNEVAWAPDYSAARSRSLESGRPILLFYTATWCVPCRIMKRTVWADEQVADEVNTRFIPFMVYADDPDAAELFSRYQVGATPTTIITDAEGSVLQWVYGKVDKTEFFQFLEKAAAPPAGHRPL